MKYTNEQVKKFLDGVYNGTIAVDELPLDLYTAIANYLKEGVYKGFVHNSLSDFVGTKDYALVVELRENIYMFSAAKTYQQTKDISSLLLDGDRVRSREEFNKLGRETFDTWNNDWGKSEYNTAIASASMANKWQDIEANKDILPYLRYSTIGDACDICAPLNGMIAPVDDKRWSTVYPPNHFNCFCVVLQEESGRTTPKSVSDESASHMSDVFKMNSGKDKVIFSDDHPYFQVAPKDKDYAANNFNLPIPTPEQELKTDKNK